MAKDPWSRPSLAAELIQAASRALSSSASHLARAVAGRSSATARAERERRVQTTKVPAVGAGDGAGDGNTETAAARRSGHRGSA